MDAIASCVSTAADAGAAAREACARVPEGMGDRAPDPTVVFATPDLMASAPGIAAIIGDRLGPGALIGCPAEAVVGTGREVQSPPGGHRLVLGEHVLAQGAVGVVVPGAVALVSRGCRPVGPEMTITRGGNGEIEELAGKPALQRVREVVEALPDDERAMVEQGVMAGLAVDGDKPRLEQGDFLIRGILRGDPGTGAIAVGEEVRVGKVMRLQVRDHASADADLRRVLAQEPPGTARGALVFTCDGRGTRMFPAPHHDAAVVSDVLGPLPLAGLSCNGEIGPVGGRAYLHGFTATMAMFTSA